MPPLTQIFDENAPITISRSNSRSALAPLPNSKKVIIRPSRSVSNLSTDRQRTKSSLGISGSMCSVAEDESSADLSVSMMDKPLSFDKDTSSDGEVMELARTVKGLEKKYKLVKGSVKGWAARIIALERSQETMKEELALLSVDALAQVDIPDQHADPVSLSFSVTQPPVPKADFKPLPPFPLSPFATFDLNPIASPPVLALRARRAKEAAIKRASIRGLDGFDIDHDVTGLSWQGWNIGEQGQVLEGEEGNPLEEQSLVSATSNNGSETSNENNLATPCTNERIDVDVNSDTTQAEGSQISMSNFGTREGLAEVGGGEMTDHKESVAGVETDAQVSGPDHSLSAQENDSDDRRGVVVVPQAAANIQKAQLVVQGKQIMELISRVAALETARDKVKEEASPPESEKSQSLIVLLRMYQQEKARRESIHEELLSCRREVEISRLNVQELDVKLQETEPLLDLRSAQIISGSPSVLTSTSSPIVVALTLSLIVSLAWNTFSLLS